MTKTHTHQSAANASALAEEIREYTAMKYAGDCKCGKCQLVPRALVERIYHTLNCSTSIPAQGGGLTSDLMSATTVSCTGLEITIACSDHDTKDALMAVLVDACQGQDIT